MIMNVIGVQVGFGSFSKDGKDINFNNIKIHALKPNDYDTDDHNFGRGFVPVLIKFNNTDPVVKSIFGDLITKEFLFDMVGGDYDFYFDEKGNINRIIEPSGDPNAKKKGA